MSWNLLERFLESEHFNKDPTLCIQYLLRYSDHVGIQYALCSKLRNFSYDELEFALPQLCQLLISVDNESMALEEFILDLCEESVNASLLTFWLFQTYLKDLSSNPQSEHFRTCSRVYNKVQRIVFGGSDTDYQEEIKTNVLPVVVLTSLILASVACPWLPSYAGPLALAQARKPRPVENVLSEGAHEITISRSHSLNDANRKSKNKDKETSARGSRTPQRLHSGSTMHSMDSLPTPDSNLSTTSLPDTEIKPEISIPNSTTSIITSTTTSSTTTIAVPTIAVPTIAVPTTANTNPTTAATASATAPAPTIASTAAPITNTSTRGRRPRRNTHTLETVHPSQLSSEEKTRLLRSNYFRSETAFLSALEGISNRLVSVPKPARLSALRAELALIAQDLPAEVDIPVISPASLEDGQASQSKHHRIVRLNPAEATSLNSAERVPYLLMVEVIREDFDFNPDSEDNMLLLNRLVSESGSKRRIFDLTDAARESARDDLLSPDQDGDFETASGDLGNSSLINLLGPSENEKPTRKQTPLSNGQSKPITSRSSATYNHRSSLTGTSTPRTSYGEYLRAGSPGSKKAHSRSFTPDQPDVSALATHMRTAAQMLAQLDQSGAKRPKQEVAAIKAKIIASMQSLEEQSFLMDDPSVPTTFDTIMAKAETDALAPIVMEESIDGGADPEVTINTAAGEARMENDQITGGVKRIGDRDDPSAATFGEDWEAKKERIRRSSPFGWMKNWDLISVIVKTGADLRQEAFACQLIRVCSKIWESHNVPVWTKDMRILVTGESSGLIETITNGVSLHSLKRSLTLASIADGTNTRKRIATLKDHFVKTFGETESESYQAAIDAFAQSLAAYSVISYVLQLKDRHNGNLLIDNLGHIVHIDFGFMLSNSPGSMGFEAAPFKLTYEYIEVLGGMTAPHYEKFKKLCKKAFHALRRDAEKLISLVDIMGRQSAMPCFASGGQQAVNALRARFVLHLSNKEADSFVEELIAKSAGSYYTRLYDTFQYRTQGIY